MLEVTSYSITPDLLIRAQTDTAKVEHKLSLNEPTGKFFYDPWTLKDEYKGTVWEQILSVLPSNIGEARLIRIQPGTSYYAHADMDDRYHLNISGTRCFLIDLDNELMHSTKPDMKWYSMDAGRIHTAANFGNTDRVQLVVRKLLLKNTLQDSMRVKIVKKFDIPEYRYVFDSKISPWLNHANKMAKITDFIYHEDETVSFEIERSCIKELIDVVPDIFEVVR